MAVWHLASLTTNALDTIAMLAQGTHWAVEVTQAFFENVRRQFVILHR
jgi:hypothetical protein